jgi:hypothetical protein
MVRAEFSKHPSRLRGKALKYTAERIAEALTEARIRNEEDQHAATHGDGTAAILRLRNREEMTSIIKQLQAENAELRAEVDAHRASLIEDAKSGALVTREDFAKIIGA